MYASGNQHAERRLEALLPWNESEGGRSVADRIVRDVGDRIVQGDIAPGALLTEAEVALRHGASRTPAREALLRLESWGLVRLMPKKGAIVTVPTGAERRDLLAVRSMLERNAVEGVVADEARRTRLVAELGALLEEQARRVESPREFATLDYAFHRRIVRDDGNAVIAEIATALAPRLLRLTHRAVEANAGRLARLQAEHVELAQAIERADPAAYARLVAAHLEAGHADYEVAE
jgi:DNA-binding GntR family transcriptional regulator